MSPCLQRASTVSQQWLNTNSPGENGQPALKPVRPVYFLLALSFMIKTMVYPLASFPLLLLPLVRPGRTKASQSPWPRAPPKNAQHSPDFILRFLPLPWNQTAHKRCGPGPICPTFPTILSQKAKYCYQKLNKISP